MSTYRSSFVSVKGKTFTVVITVDDDSTQDVTMDLDGEAPITINLERQGDDDDKYDPVKRLACIIRVVRMDISPIMLAKSAMVVVTQGEKPVFVGWVKGTEFSGDADPYEGVQEITAYDAMSLIKDMYYLKEGQPRAIKTFGEVADYIATRVNSGYGSQFVWGQLDEYVRATHNYTASGEKAEITGKPLSPNAVKVSEDAFLPEYYNEQDTSEYTTLFDTLSMVCRYCSMTALHTGGAYRIVDYNSIAKGIGCSGTITLDILADDNLSVNYAKAYDDVKINYSESDVWLLPDFSDSNRARVSDTTWPLPGLFRPSPEDGNDAYWRTDGSGNQIGVGYRPVRHPDYPGTPDVIDGVYTQTETTYVGDSSRVSNQSVSRVYAFQSGYGLALTSRSLHPIVSSLDIKIKVEFWNSEEPTAYRNDQKPTAPDGITVYVANGWDSSTGSGGKPNRRVATPFAAGTLDSDPNKTGWRTKYFEARVLQSELDGGLFVLNVEAGNVFTILNSVTVEVQESQSSEITWPLTEPEDLVASKSIYEVEADLRLYTGHGRFRVDAPVERQSVNVPYGGGIATVQATGSVNPLEERLRKAMTRPQMRVSGTFYEHVSDATLALCRLNYLGMYLTVDTYSWNPYKSTVNYTFVL